MSELATPNPIDNAKINNSTNTKQIKNTITIINNANGKKAEEPITDNTAVSPLILKKFLTKTAKD